MGFWVFFGLTAKINPDLSLRAFSDGTLRLACQAALGEGPGRDPDHGGAVGAVLVKRLEAIGEDRIDWQILCAQRTGRGQEVDLIVRAWCGAIGLSWAVRNPERVRRIIILNAWAFNIPPDGSLPGSLQFARTGIGAFLINRFNAFSGLAVRMTTAKKLDPDVARGLTAPYRGKPADRLATLRSFQDIPLSESDPAWAMLDKTEQGLDTLKDKPVMFAWGTKDFVFNDKVLAMWKQFLPDAPVHYFEDAGHYVMEDAAERIVQLAVPFLAD